ncbi:MAG TPA: HlyD family efflux transporter periplasmic adaptor subunit [Limnochordales bacterium]
MAVLAVVGVWLLAASLRARLDMWLLETAAAEYRTLEDSFAGLAMVVRDEALLTAPAAGRVHLLVSDGSRVRAQAVVASIETPRGEQLVRTAEPGTVHFYWDGWEQQVELDLLLHRAVQHWREVQPAPGRTVDGQEVRQGDPVARVVDSHRIRLYLDLPEGVSLAPGMRVELRMPGVAEQPLAARVVALGGGRPAAVLVELDRYLPVLDAARWVDVEVVRARHQGIVVPVDAIVWEAGRPGVYVRRQTRLVFRPVRIGAQVGPWAVVEGIGAGDQFVVNPGRLAGR